ncbi:MAG: DASS family sodium-coupled anion symporter [Verrucomicrobia bacterium]|nr:DASS family sodium-coupled anion symporter [Verrucomicrobiota bacterium]
MPNSSNNGFRQKLGFGLAFLVSIVFLVLPRPDGLSSDGWITLGCGGLMAVLWMTEALPIAVTALLPLVMFPILKVEAFSAVAVNYADSNIFLYMGGFFIAAAMQKWGLHRRIALRLLSMIGSSPRRIVLGFMVATAFISMWVSNTATAMMIYPIGLAVIVEMVENRSSVASGDSDSNRGFRTALMLGIAYSASIGGIATLIGTPPNLVFAGSVARLYPDAPEISFMNWFAVGILLTSVFLPIAWIVLTRVVFQVDGRPVAGGRKTIREALEQLGPMGFGEQIVAVVFSLTAFAWITRGDLAIGSFAVQGWASRLNLSDTVNDSTVAMLAACLLFAIPVNLNEGKFVLDWQSAERIPWGILIVFGGGIALADVFKSSGLSEWFGAQLSLVANLPLPVMILLTCLTLTFLTELTSNVATATIFMPIVASMASVARVHPFLLMIPATISASCAFMLPVATPPNAIIFASGHVTIPEMVKAGFILNIVGVLLVTLLGYFVVVPVFDISLGSLPSWVTE